MTGKLLFFLFCISFATSSAGANDWDMARACSEAVSIAEPQAGIPNGLLGAISRVESGRRDPLSGRTVAWPWTVNAAGKGYFYPSKVEAVAAVEAFQSAGITSIDVGCMQVNLHHHPNAFLSLEEAFDPLTNVRYGASFLKNLFTQLHGWSAATAAYHSLTPALGAEYEEHVMAVWNGKNDLYRPPDFLPQVVMTGSGLQVIVPQFDEQIPAKISRNFLQAKTIPPRNFPPSIVSHTTYAPPPRIIHHVTSNGGGTEGHGRDLMSYRASPVRMAWRQN
ncbi:MAG: transglycosylase SLT domain-containing protein [Gluconobacter sp.]